MKEKNGCAIQSLRYCRASLCGLKNLPIALLAAACNLCENTDFIEGCTTVFFKRRKKETQLLFLVAPDAERPLRKDSPIPLSSKSSSLHWTFDLSHLVANCQQSCCLELVGRHKGATPKEMLQTWYQRLDSSIRGYGKRCPLDTCQLFDKRKAIHDDDSRPRQEKNWAEGPIPGYQGGVGNSADKAADRAIPPAKQELPSFLFPYSKQAFHLTVIFLLLLEKFLPTTLLLSPLRTAGDSCPSYGSPTSLASMGGSLRAVVGTSRPLPDYWITPALWRSKKPQILDLARKDCTVLGPGSDGNELGYFSSTLIFLRAPLHAPRAPLALCSPLIFHWMIRMDFAVLSQLK
ncbi:hypothetical protein GOBAR_AA14739 [Gossypium barbadense]|uniref:Uncharacterized protein n=1 Tax=Gossypium barbadense TaxID=3634 RepID=A0A2P5XRJ4_GOSBA|nr:hypothetical protein GOBAR_AA14739 [Gossypium barbadense]